MAGYEPPDARADLPERPLLHRLEIRYAQTMASDRMMQAIGTLERAVSRLEQDVSGLIASAAASPAPTLDQGAARAALRSLDDLIDTLKGQAHG
ncbi:hypothetical protein [Sphingobium sp.]|uniref:hypothetical protein n=1 Tax=Sphingobium sp. TaxID=1912891 RepID=UPI003B3A997F